MKQLYLSLKKAGLMFKGLTEQGEVDFILLETYENGTRTSVDLNTFETLFGDVEGNPTYESCDYGIKVLNVSAVLDLY